jgi:hypothetical protein
MRDAWSGPTLLLDADAPIERFGVDQRPRLNREKVRLELLETAFRLGDEVMLASDELLR